MSGYKLVRAHVETSANLVFKGSVENLQKRIKEMEDYQKEKKEKLAALTKGDRSKDVSLKRKKLQFYIRKSQTKLNALKKALTQAKRKERASVVNPLVRSKIVSAVSEETIKAAERTVKELEEDLKYSRERMREIKSDRSDSGSIKDQSERIKMINQDLKKARTRLADLKSRK